jgi:hypothetical protein
VPGHSPSQVILRASRITTPRNGQFVAYYRTVAVLASAGTIRIRMGAGEGQQRDIRERAAISLIAADTEFFRNLALKPRFDRIRPIAILALLPFLSAFVYEAAKFIERRDLAAVAELKQHERLLSTSRLRLKLFDDNRKSVTEILDDASALAAINSAWMFDDHRGLLGPLKRFLQQDLGVYFVQNEVICTTHVAFLNLGISKERLLASGLTQETLGPFMRDTMEDVGGYTALLMHRLAIDTEALGAGSEVPVPPIQFRDLKSQRFYESMARLVAPRRTPVCILLTAILSQINTARVVVPMIAAENRVAAFKMGFLALYHAASSLQQLLDEDRKTPFLLPDAARRIGAMLGASPVRNVRKKRRLRNHLMHYAIEDRIAPDLSPKLLAYGLVEACSNGQSFESMAKGVELGLHSLSDELYRFLPQRLTPQGTL